MNLTLQEGVALAKEVNSRVAATTTKCQVILGTPFVHITEVVKTVDNAKVQVAAQNCANKVSGAFTGEVSAAMVKSTGANWVILGHSERRAYYGETAAILKEKTDLALANDLQPIFCVGEVLAEREAEKHFEVVKQQLADSLFHLTADQFKKIVIAYEPVWAIGTGVVATDEQAQDTQAFVRSVMKNIYGESVSEAVRIQYGGSMKPDNAKGLLAQKDIDGGLIGGAALKSDSFFAIIAAAEAQ